MTSITAIFFDLDGTLVDSSIGIHNAFTWCLALMPKLFVVLWDHLSKVVLRPACPKTKFLKPCRYIVLTIRQKASMKLNSFLRL
ncbi:phosphatase [Streptococcus pneumoniae]|nr:phosphatase [Streptococcus pneumoniae]